MEGILKLDQWEPGAYQNVLPDGNKWKDPISSNRLMTYSIELHLEGKPRTGIVHT